MPNLTSGPFNTQRLLSLSTAHAKFDFSVLHKAAIVFTQFSAIPTVIREVMEGKKSPHALVISLPFQGHVIPLMELSSCLIDHGFRITFVAAEFCHDLIMAAATTTAKATADGDVGDRIRLVAITDGMAPGEDWRDIGKACERYSKVVPGALEELIGNINGSGHEYGKITCVITDGCIAGAVPLGRKMGIPTAVLWPASASFLAVLSQIPRLIQDGIINVDGTIAKHGMFRLSPTMPEMDPAHLFWLCIEGSEAQKAFFHYSIDGSKELNAADWLLCNSFYDLEQSACELVGRVQPVGPLIAGRRHGSLEGNFWQEDSTCLTWLDQQPEDSVIYIASGSFTIFNQYQFQELALGLELSGKRFLWVVRPDLIDDGSKEENGYCPNGFKDRVGSRGRIVGWSPQQKVLAHPAISCFFTHCGWNSTIEGLSNGIPFLCLPFNSDQFLNMAYITNVWKVGLEVKAESGDGIISREVIKRKLEELLGDKEIKARSLELKALARKSVSQGGSSWRNFNNFIEAMKSMSC